MCSIRSISGFKLSTFLCKSTRIAIWLLRHSSLLLRSASKMASFVSSLRSKSRFSASNRLSLFSSSNILSESLLKILIRNRTKSYVSSLRFEVSSASIFSIFGRAFCNSASASSNLNDLGNKRPYLLAFKSLVFFANSFAFLDQSQIPLCHKFVLLF